MPSASDLDRQVRELIRILTSDTLLNPRIHAAARRLRHVRALNAAAALGQLDRLHRVAVACLPTQAPTVEYARVVGLNEFYEFNLSPARKEFFTTPAGYIDHVSTTKHPETALMNDVGTQDAVDAEHAWILPYSYLEGLNGIEAKTLLRFDQAPPYAVMVFSVVKMVANNVQVRDPCGLDAIPERILDWFPGNVPDEKINSDIPRAALDRIAWLP